MFNMNCTHYSVWKLYIIYTISFITLKKRKKNKINTLLVHVSYDYALCRWFMISMDKKYPQIDLRYALLSILKFSKPSFVNFWNDISVKNNLLFIVCFETCFRFCKTKDLKILVHIRMFVFLEIFWLFWRYEALKLFEY
jgi:hypothetical protein